MKLFGYSDRLSVAPGDEIRFMVSCAYPSYRADLVRLVHGDGNPKGPGYKEREVPSSISRDHAGREQSIRTGSYVVVDDASPLQLTGSFTLAVWVYATTPGNGVQGLMTKGAPGVGGYGLRLEDRGDVALWLDDGAGNNDVVRTGAPVVSHRWYLVAASFDAERGQVTLYQAPLLVQPLDLSRIVLETSAKCRPGDGRGAPFLMGAWHGTEPDPRRAVGHHFNGKLDRPRVFGRVLTAEELEALRAVDAPEAVTAPVVAAWDFSLDMASATVVDTGPNRLNGRAVGLPARAVTGFNWDGSNLDFKEAPEQYGAIYFHDDDFEDAGWDVAFTFTVPDDLPSGVYAARLRSQNSEEYVPFFVRPPRGRATSRIALLFPTFTYVTYANFHDLSSGTWDPLRVPNADPDLQKEQYDFILQNNMLSLYDYHSDGSGTVYSSRLRPIFNMRPKFRYRVWSAPSRFPADLYMVDWLEEKGFQADVITDDDLHNEGSALLEQYRVVITGSHPEYWTSRMLASLDAYLSGGGRMMYLGGNGFYGIVSVDPERPYFVELRRWGGSWPFELPSGERYHNTTGEPGGIWRNRGRPPQQIVGVGSCSAGFDRGSPYIRQPGSYDARARFIFEGIPDNEMLGDFPSLVMKHGAAGYEMDRLDHQLGTPAHALLLASSVGHSAGYAAFREEQAPPRRRVGDDGGKPDPFVRSDIVYFETPNGGAVFSVGSIGFRASLSYNGYENNISRMVENVLRRFSSA